MRLSLGRIIAMILRHLYLFPRSLEHWAESIYWPVVDLLIWGLATRWIESSGGDVPLLALIVLTGGRLLADRLAGQLRDLGQPAARALEPEPGQPLRHAAVRLGMVGEPGRAGSDQERADACSSASAACGCFIA